MKKSRRKSKRRNPVAASLIRYTASGPMRSEGGGKSHGRDQRRKWKSRLRKENGENF